MYDYKTKKRNRWYKYSGKKLLFTMQKYYETGGKSMKHLSYRLRKQQADRNIYKIRNSTTNEIETSLEKIQQCFQEYYKQLYSQPQTDKQWTNKLMKCENYRPVSLLNNDYKLFTSILSKWIELILPVIIHEDQADVIRQRQTQDNIKKTLCVMIQVTQQTLEALVLSLNTEKNIWFSEMVIPLLSTWLIWLLYNYNWYFCNTI